MKSQYSTFIIICAAMFIASSASAEHVYSVANSKKVYYTEECIQQFKNQEGVFINQDLRIALESEGYVPDLECYGQKEYDRRIQNAIPKASDDFNAGRITLEEELKRQRSTEQRRQKMIAKRRLQAEQRKLQAKQRSETKRKQ